MYNILNTQPSILHTWSYLILTYEVSTISIFAFQIRVKKVDLPRGTQPVGGRSKFEYNCLIPELLTGTSERMNEWLID